ncbi:LytTR family DNA-binding domain-containing protein [Hymenobacter sp. ASUV-10]|uniref:LytTR family DNA-binding domain-containing protein n=1 Tax=Hymenobacter aranciens TaxID=3063996 RepID=A0ABT9BIR1_9BACT|nr:LytTR family DNA-binding domain-containing protein [Hymenobacter sp. ASUV-10]MDO7877568.1 LytTR family DNA-binding domain-containing protein [Hymenobacter sp. ASUV-10]
MDEENKVAVRLVTTDPALADLLTPTLCALGYALPPPAAMLAGLAWPAPAPLLLLLDLDGLPPTEPPALAALLAGPDLVQALLLTSTPSPPLLGLALPVARLQWLAKPVQGLALANALAAAQLALDLRQQASQRRRWLKYLTVTIGPSQQRLHLSRVLYLETDDKYVTAVTATGRYVLRRSLKMLLLRLRPDRFVRIHHSYAINLKYLRALPTDALNVQLLTHTLPVGRHYREALRRQFHKR